MFFLGGAWCATVIMFFYLMIGCCMLCQVFPKKYAEQLVYKVQHLKTLMPQLQALEVFESAPQHYRARTEFSVWHEGDVSHYIMFDGAQKKRVQIDDCPMVIESINDLMPRLLAAINAEPVLRERLFEVDFLATLSGQMLVTLIYRRSIENDLDWLGLARQLKESLPITHLIGRARKEKVVLDEDFVVETLQVDGQALHYQQIENSFTQPNAAVAQKMLSWGRKIALQIGLASDKPRDLIELYCGNGHFSIALAPFFGRVLATEISRSSVHSAHFNMALNGVDNLQVVKMAAQEVSLALQGQAFNRLANVDLAGFDFGTIFVDPPRSGLDDLTRKMVCAYDHIIYISCNPQTLAHDLVAIEQSHEVVASALFDQFPYTPHIESGVYLKRKLL